MVKALQQSDIQGRLNGLGFVTAPSSPEQLAERIRNDIARYVKVASDAGIAK